MNPNASNLLRLSVVGCGRAGGTVAAALGRTGLVEIGQVVNRSLASAESAVEALGHGQAVAKIESLSEADIWLISTSDGEIGPSAARLAQSGPGLGGSVVFHLSGRFGPDVLDSAASVGAVPASVHPVRSMPKLATGADSFNGTVCIAEGAPEALDILRGPFLSAGAGWRVVSGLERGLYHAALAIISNVTKGVIWKAQTWLEAAGLDSDTAAEVSHSLLSITTEDVFREGARQSITGPVVRGDTSTVVAHLEALRRIGRHDSEIYRILALTVLDLANERGDLDAEILQQFEQLLGERAPDS